MPLRVWNVDTGECERGLDIAQWAHLTRANNWATKAPTWRDDIGAVATANPREVCRSIRVGVVMGASGR